MANWCSERYAMFKNYLLTAFKVYTRRKMFTAINLACIVLTLVVLMVVAALAENAFRPSGVEGRSDRFLQVWMVQTQHPRDNWASGGPLGYKLIESHLKPLASARIVATVSNAEPVSVYHAGQVHKLMLRHTDAPYWQVLNFRLLAGRLTRDDDDAQGRAVAVVNQSTARKLFGAGRALGEKISVGGRFFEIVGVVGDELHINAFADLWVPISSQLSSDYRHQVMGNFNALLMADSPAGLPAIRAEVERAARGVRYDDDRAGATTHFWADSKLDMFARILTHNNDRPDSGAAGVLAAAVGLMLLFMLLPALNLVNLSMGRIMERSTEIGVRKAFGATRRQLVTQLLLENLLLCLAGGVLGLAGSAGVLAWLEASGLIPYLRVNLNLTVFGWGLLISLVFGLLSGVIPAWRMSRMDPVFALKGAA